jgi:hypothetical protein
MTATATTLLLAAVSCNSSTKQAPSRGRILGFFLGAVPATGILTITL